MSFPHGQHTLKVPQTKDEPWDIWPGWYRRTVERKQDPRETLHLLGKRRATNEKTMAWQVL